MMKVIFDHQIFSLQQYGGISRYFCELATHLDKNDGVKPTILAFIHQNRHLHDTSNIAKYSTYIRPIKKTTLLRFFLNTFFFEMYNQLSAPDIIHRTYYGKYFSGRAKQVTTIHDLIPEKYPQHFDNVELFLRLKYQSIMKSDRIICVSNSTKIDLIDCYGIPESKVTVIHLASSLSPRSGFSSQSMSISRIGVKEPYILYIGARFGYKNFTKLLNAISRSKRIRGSYSLVCFGGPSFSAEEINLISTLYLRNKVFHLTGDDNLLCQLYQNASLFVYPSQYEGFGIPLIEAMSLSCPVACSDISVFREICDSAAVFFDPLNESEIRDTMESILFSKEVKQNIVQMGRENSKRFSWAKSAQSTLSAYKDLLMRK